MPSSTRRRWMVVAACLTVGVMASAIVLKLAGRKAPALSPNPDPERIERLEWWEYGEKIVIADRSEIKSFCEAISSARAYGIIDRKDAVRRRVHIKVFWVDGRILTVSPQTFSEGSATWEFDGTLIRGAQLSGLVGEWHSKLERFREGDGGGDDDDNESKP